MESAFPVFESLEEPTGVAEDWRYVDFDMPFSGLTLPDEPGDRLPAGPFLEFIGDTSGHVLIIDGSVVALDSDVASVSTLQGSEERDFSMVPPDHNKLAAAHAAFATDAIFIDFPSGEAAEHPLIIEVEGTVGGSASFPHIVIDIGQNAQAEVLTVFRSADGESLLMVPEVDLRVGDGANLRYLSLQSLDQAATCVLHQRMTLGRDATGRLGEVGLGSKLGRLDLDVRLEGDGASSNVSGLYFGEGAQTLDYRMVINHAGRSTTSDVFLKGAVEDEAQSVFTGLLRIEKNAVKTSTFETNRNLVLSDKAKAHSVPNLEILCNDVICGHGSSVGPLEQEHLYYLQSRGLGKERSERLLIKGFFREAIDRLPIEGLEEPISTEVFRRFVEAQRAGRVA